MFLGKRVFPDQPPGKGYLSETDLASTRIPLGARRWSRGTLVYTFGGLVALFLLVLLGDFAWAMRDRSVGPMAQWYLSELKVSNLLFGLLITSLPAAIGLMVGPIISVRSDRHRGKWGRRIPYLLITTPLGMVGMFGLGLSPYIAEWVHTAFAPGQPSEIWIRRFVNEGHCAEWLLQVGQNKTSVALICFCVFWTCFELAALASHSLFSGLVNDIVPRELIGRFYALFRAISLIDGMIFSQMIFGHIAGHYTLIFFVIGLFYGICFTGVCLLVKEGSYPPPPPTAPSQKVLSGFLHEIFRYLRECFSNPFYVLVFLLITIANLTFLPVNTFLMPFSKSLHIDPQSYGHYFFLIFATSLCLAFPLGWLADKFHPLRITIITLVAYAVVTLLAGFFITDASTFLLALLAHGIISGCYYTSIASLGNRLFPSSRFAQFVSAAGIIGSLSGIVFAPLIGALIDWSGKTYRYTCFYGFAFSIVALLLAWQVHRRFIKLGGPTGYAAPE